MNENLECMECGRDMASVGFLTLECQNVNCPNSLDFGNCSVDGCGGAAHSKGLCSKHYTRLRRTGSTDERAPGACRICGGPTNARGLCMAHYQSFRRMAAERGLSLDAVMPKG